MKRLIGFFPEMVVGLMLTVHTVMGVISLYRDVPAKIYARNIAVIKLPEYWLVTMILVFALFLLWKNRPSNP